MCSHLHTCKIQQMQDIAHFTTNPMIMDHKVNAISWEFSLHVPTAYMQSYQYKSKLDQNSEIHSFNTKNKLNLHPPLQKLTVYQRGPYYSGIKAFNNLPSYIKNLLQTTKQFTQALKEFLHFHSFYSLNEFYNYNRTQNF